MAENGTKCKNVLISSASIAEERIVRCTMSIENEIEIYKKAFTTDSGEVEIFDEVIFPNAIRKREISIIIGAIQTFRPKKVLDFGCGGGWLPKVLGNFECEVIGVDITQSLISSAKKVNPDLDFLVADCMRLPFMGGSFELIIGIGILHHLDLRNALIECNRVLAPEGRILFMEPNALNPLMAIGRRILPSEIHTTDEHALYPNQIISEVLSEGFKLESIEYLFPFSFCISYFIARVKSKYLLRLAKKTCNLLTKIEKTYESVPLLNNTSGAMLIIAKK
jgi:SAM-dependent methyltransferase